MLPFDLDSFEIRPSKHFRNTKMRKWDWDVHDVREALAKPTKVVKRSSAKFEVWVRKSGSKKLILACYSEERVVLIVTGTEG